MGMPNYSHWWKFHKKLWIGPVAPKGMVWTFIDEANPIYNPNGHVAWDTDLAALRAIDHKQFRLVCCGVLGGSWGIPPGSLYPTGRPWPEEILYYTIGRPPSLESLQNIYLEFRTNPIVGDRVTFIIDVSGSMVRRSIAAGLDPLIVWLNDLGVITQEIHMNTERWVQFTKDALINLLEVL